MNSYLFSVLGFTIVTVVISVGTDEAFGWGDEGHETVGAIADQLLKGTKAEQEVRKLLMPKETLSSISTWADCAKYCKHKSDEMLAFIHQNPKHADYHFTDIPFQHTHYDAQSVGAGPNDVVQIVEQAIHVLRGQANPTHNPHHLSPRQAILLLTHLVGDLHQPLHVGPSYITRANHVVDPPNQAALDSHAVFATHGDNWLMYEGKKLHGLWDSQFVKYGMKMALTSAPVDYAAYLLEKDPAPEQDAGDVGQWPKAWADESLQRAKAAHRQLTVTDRKVVMQNGSSHLQWEVSLPKDYTKQATLEARRALLLAGKRLALLLRAIWPD